MNSYEVYHDMLIEYGKPVLRGWQVRAVCKKRALLAGISIVSWITGCRPVCRKPYDRRYVLKPTKSAENMTASGVETLHSEDRPDKSVAYRLLLVGSPEPKQSVGRNW